MRILHIANWYPNIENGREALFIKRHIDALEKYSQNTVIHFEVRYGRLNLRRGKYDDNSHYCLIFLPFKLWVLTELISSTFLTYYLLKHKKKFDVFNIHIAYPLCTFIHLSRKWISQNIIITEHWSAYHYNFGVAKHLPRIANIFKQNLPLITVSAALNLDIEKFCGTKQNVCVIPNIIDTNVFHKREMPVDPHTYFMVSLWKWPKSPIKGIKIFEEIRKLRPKSKLNIGGYGPLLCEIENYLTLKNLKNCVSLLGKLSSEDIALHMNSSYGFIHASDYETFSVVCAEAICCGCPTLASSTGGIVEVIDHKQTGYLFNNSVTTKEIASEWLQFVSTADRTKVSQIATEKNDPLQIGFKYADFIKKSVKVNA